MLDSVSVKRACSGICGVGCLLDSITTAQSLSRHSLFNVLILIAV